MLASQAMMRTTRTSGRLAKSGRTNGASEQLGGESALGTLRRGLRVLNCFSVMSQVLTIGQISTRTGLPKSTAHRIVRMLESEGYLTFDPETGSCHLGSSLLHTLYALKSPENLAGIAHRHLVALATETGESVSFSVPTAQGAVIADTVHTTHPFKLNSAVGQLFDSFSNANNKVFLAFGPENWQRSARYRQMERHTEYSIVDPEKLAEEIARVRSERLAYDLQEWRLGVCAVAAPVRGSTGQVEASLSVYAPAERFSTSKRAAYAEALRRVVPELERDLGYCSTERSL